MGQNQTLTLKITDMNKTTKQRKQLKKYVDLLNKAFLFMNERGLLVEFITITKPQEPQTPIVLTKDEQVIKDAVNQIMNNQ